MAIINQPADTCQPVEYCELAECPRIINNCGRGCFEVHKCKDAVFPIDLGCNLFTGDEVQAPDLLGLNVKVYHETDLGNVVDATYNLVDDAAIFTQPNQFNYVMTVPGSETRMWTTGAAVMEISIITAEGEWKIYKFKLCVESEMLAPPCIAITGNGDVDESFTLNAGELTLWFHNSDIIHSHKEWNRFVVQWGDGNTDTLDVSALQPPDALTWFLAHTYTASGTYTVEIEGFSDYDDTDPCDVELSDCGSFSICVQVP